MRPSAPVSLVACLAFAGCGGGGGGGPDASAAPGVVFVSGIRHSFFPLMAGSDWTFEGEEEGLPRREEVRVLDGTQRVAGVDCTALEQEIFVDGRLAEVTTEWFAEDRTGNVWKFGESSVEVDDLGLERTADSWLAGVEGAKAFLALPRRLIVGDVFLGYRPEGPEEFRVVSVTDNVSLPGGAFQNCLRLWENPLDVDDADILLYAPGVGRIAESSTTGYIVLVSSTVP